MQFTKYKSFVVLPAFCDNNQMKIDTSEDFAK
jgi:hypothetical protein